MHLGNKKNRLNGDVIMYHSESNTFAVMDKMGSLRTMFKPDPLQHGYKTNLEYFYGQKLFICKVCGYNYGDYIWGEDGKSPTFLICPCCGTEFGYQDSTLKAIMNQRNKCENLNYKWKYEDEKPQNWDLEKQLVQIPDEYK